MASQTAVIGRFFGVLSLTSLLAPAPQATHAVDAFLADFVALIQRNQEDKAA